MTVAGCELSRVVSQEVVKEYTEALSTFLHRKYRINMRRSENMGTALGSSQSDSRVS